MRHRFTIAYDASCQLCRAFVYCAHKRRPRRFRSIGRNHARADPRFAECDLAREMAAADADGNVVVGAEAVAAVLSSSLDMPSLRAVGRLNISRWLYRLVAGQRHRLGCGTTCTVGNDRKRGTLTGLAVPLIAGSWALAHLAITSNGTLTRWKGGGFGMYSEVHFQNGRLLAQGIDDDPMPTGKAEEQLAFQVKRHPTTANWTALARRIADRSGSDDFRLQLWRPYLTADNRCTRRVISSFHYHAGGHGE